MIVQAWSILHSVVVAVKLTMQWWLQQAAKASDWSGVFLETKWTEQKQKESINQGDVFAQSPSCAQKIYCMSLTTENCGPEGETTH